MIKPSAGSAATLAICGVVPALVSCSQISGTADMMGAALRTAAEPPETTPHALLRISTDGYTWVQPGTACEWTGNPRGGIAVTANQIYIGARGFTGRVLGVVGDAPKGLSSGELRVAANEPVTVAYSAFWTVGNLNYNCYTFRSFVPVQGAHYQLLTSANTTQRRCGMVALQLAPVPLVVPLVVQMADAPKCKLP